MGILSIEYQKHHVQINICIKGEVFPLTALIDLGADVNILSKKVIPSKFWVSATRKFVGLGTKSYSMKFPKQLYALTPTASN